MDDGVLKLIGILGKLFVGWACYAFAKDLSKQANRAKAYTWAIAVAIGLGILAHHSIGTRHEGGDPLFGGGEEIYDFEQSPERRTRAGWKVFFLTAIAFSVGVYRGTAKTKRRSSTVELQESAKNEPLGIGGWLLFFCISLLILTPLAEAFGYISLVKQYQTLVLLNPETAERFRIAVGVSYGPVFLITLTGMVVAFLLLFRMKHAVTITKVFLFANPIASILVAINAAPLFKAVAGDINILGAVGVPFFRSIVFSAIWLAYFYKSKRVKSTFRPEQTTAFRFAPQMNWKIFLTVCLGFPFFALLGVSAFNNFRSVATPVTASAPAVVQNDPPPADQASSEQRFKDEYAKHEAVVFAKYPDVAEPGTAQYSLVAAEVAHLQLTEPEIFSSPDYVYKVIANVERKHPTVFRVKKPTAIPPEDLLRIKVDLRDRGQAPSGVCTNSTDWDITHIVIRVKRRYLPRQAGSSIDTPYPTFRDFALIIADDVIYPHSRGKISFEAGDYFNVREAPVEVKRIPQAYNLYTEVSVVSAEGVRYP